jgi:hypothetical protein
MTNKAQAKALRIVVDRVNDCYEIVGHDPPMGPYDTKAEAEEDLRGVKRFYQTEPDDPDDLLLEDVLS